MRIIVHKASGAFLTTDLKLHMDTNYTPDMVQSVSWVVDIDATTTLQSAGLARHMYLSPSAVIPTGAMRKHLDLQSSTSSDGSTSYSPVLLDNPAIETSVVDMQSKQGCRFLGTPTDFDLSVKAMVVDNIVATNAPVFLHYESTYLPVDVATYLTQASLISSNGDHVYPVIDAQLLDPDKQDWTLSWTPPPLTQMPKPIVYVRVLRSQETMMTGYTDIEYSMFYPTVQLPQGAQPASSHGWVRVTLRLDNETATLDSVLFSGEKR